MQLEERAAAETSLGAGRLARGRRLGCPGRTCTLLVRRSGSYQWEGLPPGKQATERDSQGHAVSSLCKALVSHARQSIYASSA